MLGSRIKRFGMEFLQKADDKMKDFEKADVAPNYFKLRGHEVHILAYEEFLYDVDGHMCSLFDFLGLSRNKKVCQAVAESAFKSPEKISAAYPELNEFSQKVKQCIQKTEFFSAYR